MLSAMIVRFTKMHGAGNDFIVIDASGSDRNFDPDKLGKSGRQQLADRHTGIGCDQLLILNPPRLDDADVWVRIFNADGTEAGQCGNGMRCIARFLADAAPGQTVWKLDSQAGRVTARIESDGSVSVDMGPPETGMRATACNTKAPVSVGSQSVDYSLVSMGNPHAVIFVDNIATAPLAEWGPALQQFFDEGVNVGFAQIIEKDHLALRVWERGVGETQACGSGACAAAVAARSAGLTANVVTIDLPGGQLMVKWGGVGESVWLRGPAQRVFEGQTEL